MLIDEEFGSEHRRAKPPTVRTTFFAGAFMY